MQRRWLASLVESLNDDSLRTPVMWAIVEPTLIPDDIEF